MDKLTIAKYMKDNCDLHDVHNMMFVVWNSSFATYGRPLFEHHFTTTDYGVHDSDLDMLPDITVNPMPNMKRFLDSIVNQLNNSNDFRLMLEVKGYVKKLQTQHMVTRQVVS